MANPRECILYSSPAGIVHLTSSSENKHEKKSIPIVKRRKRDLERLGGLSEVTELVKWQKMYKMSLPSKPGCPGLL